MVIDSTNTDKTSHNFTHPGISTLASVSVSINAVNGNFRGEMTTGIAPRAISQCTYVNNYYYLDV